jgi:hypothetical protein
MECRVEQGWIYVLVNSSIPGMAKVGRTSRPPAERVAELSGATGVATPFVLAFDQAVADCWAAERAVHDELDRRGLRVAPNREFFRGPPADIIRVVMDMAEPGDRVAPAISEGPAERLLAAGDRHLFGLGDALQDSADALRCYKLAAARGSLAAYERLGQVYGAIYVRRPDRAARRRALAPLKEGARRGNRFCYAEMAALFAHERHVPNFIKAWDLFFAGLPGAGSAPIRAGARMVAACCRYIGGCLELGLKPGHRETLAAAAGAILAALLAELDALRETDPGRRQVVRVLRWAYAELPPAADSGPTGLPERLGQSAATRPAWAGQSEIAVA